MNLVALAAVVAALASPPQAVDTFYGATLGSSVAPMASGATPKPDVFTSDVGQIWTWRQESGGTAVTSRITTDDDGSIAMIDVLARGAAGPDVAAPVRGGARIGFGTTLARAADVVFGAPEFEGAGPFPDGIGQADFRGYRLDGDREAVLLFDGSGGPLREIFFGRRAALARAGLIPHEAPPDVFKAASLSRLGSADFATRAEGVAYVRVVVNADGGVAGATLFASSGDGDLDAVAIAIARGSTFVPASRNGAPVASVYFRREDFVQSASTPR